MLDTIFDLIPDEAGEYLGCGLMTTTAYLYLDGKNSELLKQKKHVDTLKKEISKLTSTLQETCLSAEALDYIKAQGKA